MSSEKASIPLLCWKYETHCRFAGAKSVLLFRGKSFHSFSSSVIEMCYLYYTVCFEFQFDFSSFLKTGVQQKHRDLKKLTSKNHTSECLESSSGINKTGEM